MNDQTLPMPAMQRTPARHDALAVLCLITAFLFWPLSIVLGHVHRKEARQSGRRYSILTTIGLWISYLGMSGVVLFFVAGIAGSH